jgi:hypothetical protein
MLNQRLHAFYSFFCLFIICTVVCCSNTLTTNATGTDFFINDTNNTTNSEELPPPNLKRNQVGYHPTAEKLLWVEGVIPTPLEPTRFVIRNPKQKNILLSPNGVKVARPYGELLNASLILLDASALKREGLFEVFPYGGYWKPLPTSPKFNLRVSNALFYNLIAPATRTFLYNRSGQQLADATSGLLLQAGHTQPASLQGGWYEGANYHQHIVSTAWASTQLMNAYLVLGAKEGGQINLTYPSNEPKTAQLPDLLHEAQVGIRWILKLQQPDGSFLSGAYSQSNVAPTLKPANDKNLRLALPTSALSTATAVATLARAAQVFQEVDPSFAVSCLLAAKNGMEHLPLQVATPRIPTIPTFLAPLEGSVTESVATTHEAYWHTAPTSLNPTLYWAYSTLGEVTGNQPLKNKALSLVPKLTLATASWENPVPLVVSYYAHTTGLSPEEVKPLLALADQQQPLLQTIRNPLLAPASYTLQNAPKLPTDNFEWVSLGILWAEAFHLSKNPIYLTASTDVFNYLMGFNKWNQTFLTGDTNQSTDIAFIKNPCHQISRATKTLLPGFLLKGFPNSLSVGTLPFQDNSRQCDFTATSLIGQSQFIYWLALLHTAYNPKGLPVKPVVVKAPTSPSTTVGGKKVVKPKQLFPLIKRS